MMSLWDALRMNMMISYQELVRTFLRRSDYNLTLKDSRIFEGLRRDELYETALQTDYVDFTAKASQASFMQSLTLSTLSGQSSTGG